MLQPIDISTSGLVAQRQRMNTIAGNIANLNTTRDAEGNPEPYQRRFVTFTTDGSEPDEAGGVGVDYRVEIDTETTPRKVHQPGHPDADADGYVAYPNIDMVTEFVNAIEASRAYEANVTAVEVSNRMSENGFRILV